MNVEPVDFGGELRKAIEPRLAPAPIVLLPPIVADVLDPFQRRALAPVLDQFGFRPARVAQPRFEIVEHVVANRNAIGFNFSAHERPFSNPSRSCRDGFHRRKSSSHARPISREVVARYGLPFPTSTNGAHTVGCAFSPPLAIKAESERRSPSARPISG